jgi:hypothetical protein
MNRYPETLFFIRDVPALVQIRMTRRASPSAIPAVHQPGKEQCWRRAVAEKGGYLDSLPRLPAHVEQCRI